MVSTNGAGSRKAAQYLEGDVTIPLLSTREPLKAEVTDFISAIRTGLAPRSDGWMGLKVVRALEAAQRLLSEGRELIPSFQYEGAPTPMFPREPA
jgi:hypothetical protein